MATAASAAEAREHICQIRAAKGVDNVTGPNPNLDDLSYALEILSKQLYTRPTHFLLELIQNADDSTYADGVGPQLTLWFREDGYLWIGSNEVGFSKSNVESICRIGNSTKKVQEKQKGYIGEKGIGFKSVFKVADLVWITSGYYAL
ncbi:hypothetical protein LTR66_006591, partial [Elasticomyces elasticus]